MAKAEGDYLKGAILHSIQGYSVSKESYSPKYTMEDINFSKSDNRLYFIGIRVFSQL